MTENEHLKPQIGQIEEILQSIRPEPGEAFRRRMNVMPWKTGVQATPPVRVWKLILAAGLLLTAFLVFTPTGNALANNLLQFFNRAAGNVLPLAPDEVLPALEEPTPQPTRYPTLVQAIQASPDTEENAAETVVSAKTYGEQIERAAAIAGFTPWQFPQAPEGYSFQRAEARSGLTAIWYGNGNGEISIQQSRTSFLENSDVAWLSAPAEAVQAVTVGDLPAEYVRGNFMARVGEDQAVWDATSGYARLRWKDGDWWFQLIQRADPPMQPQELAGLAAQLNAAAPNDTTQDQGQADRIGDAYLTITAAQTAYGQPFKLPTLLPEGYPFSHARLIDQGILLFYGSFADDKMHANGSGLLLSQGVTDISFAQAYADYPPEAFRSTTVNGEAAWLVEGLMEVSFVADGEMQSDPVWKTEPFTLSLYWDTGGHYTMLQFFAGGDTGARITAEDLMQIAESLQ